MELVMVGMDRWMTLGTTGYEMCLRPDELTDPEYRIRVETVYFRGLHLRTLAPVPAGLWIRPIGQRELWLPPEDRYTTEEFRLSDDDQFRRIPGEGPVRRIDPRSVRPPGPADPF